MSMIKERESCLEDSNYYNSNYGSSSFQFKDSQPIYSSSVVRQGHGTNVINSNSGLRAPSSVHKQLASSSMYSQKSGFATS